MLGRTGAAVPNPAGRTTAPSVATRRRRPPDARPLVQWLAGRFNENRPWNETVREILTADGAPSEKPQGVFFILNGDSRGNPQANTIASSTAQLFMGVQLQCAECHNHPFTDWKQTDFWGLAAFFGRITLQGGAKGRSAEGYRGLLWVLLNSSEFMINR
jgi:hypothetical protein